MRARISAAAVVLGLATALAPAHAATRGITCDIRGTALLKPGLTTYPRHQNYTFKGTLSGCVASDRTLRTGTIAAAGGGRSSCISGVSKGVATIKWNNRKTTKLAYETTAFGNEITVQGRVVSGNETAARKGDQILGELVFTSFKGECTGTPKPVWSATFSGRTGLGSLR